VRGAAELLQQGLHDMPEADRARFLGNILEDAQRMERLVARLLELARLENEPRGAAPELSPAEQVQKALARHADRVQLVVEADAPARIAIEPEQLESVLGNLVENALRHGAGSPVRVTLRAERGRLRIDVHDQGPGVSEANRKRLFERFFTTQRDQGAPASAWRSCGRLRRRAAAAWRRASTPRAVPSAWCSDRRGLLGRQSPVLASTIVSRPALQGARSKSRKNVSALNPLRASRCSSSKR
jgi:hypothetical protein